MNEFGWEYSFDQKNGLVITPKATGSAEETPVDTKSDIVGQKVTVTGSDVNLRFRQQEPVTALWVWCRKGQNCLCWVLKL